MAGVKKSSIKDIARETNLSITTVSRVINGKAEEYRIGKKSQKLVLEAAKKLDYNANHAAVSLKSGKSSTIGLLVPSLSNPFFASMASEINKDLREMGFITVISESNERIEIEMEVVKNLFKRNIEGLIIVPCSKHFEHIIHLKDQGLPIVCMDRYFENLDLPYVSTDNYEGSLRATQYLIEKGHTRISCVQGVHQSVPNQQRVLGFKDAMRSAGIDSVRITGNDFSVQNGYLETKLLVHSNQLPTAIFTFSNTIAMGCLKALYEEHLKIPDDISLITFDDNFYLDYLATPLSCVVQPESDIAKLAVRFLFSIIEKSDLTGKQQVLLKPEIKIRKSVKTLIETN